MLNKRKILLVFTLTIFLISTISPKINKSESASEPVFTLVAKTHADGTVRPDYLNFLKQHLARIRINVDVIIQDWPTYYGELLFFRDFDLFCFGLNGSGADPDFTGVYDENGTLNMFGYHTSMDSDNNTLGTGENEWYMVQGTLIMPPDSEERVQHYWAWEQYLMNEICPMKPTVVPVDYAASWSNLVGYDLRNGIIQSWGQMDWVGTHTGQVSTDELVITKSEWSDLNPLFQDDAGSGFISKAIMDPLIWYDADINTWPHLATDWTMLNDTHFRISLREDIKWQTDSDGLFPNEFFDVDDVYFTLYSMKHISDDKHLYQWIEAIEKVDQYTLDVFIDGDPDTPANEPYAPFLPSLNLLILPEHYLNQTQLADGETPDISHSSWQKFTTDCFGTGLFEINDFTEGVETTLSVSSDCWFLDPLVDKSDMDFLNRFGDFSNGLVTLKIKSLSNIQSALLEFEIGNLDIIQIMDFLEKRDQYRLDPDFKVYNQSIYYLSFFGYNMRENRAHIGSREPCPGDPNITKGLAIRKAISYAIDRTEINNVMHRGEYALSYHPIFNRLGVWCNPNIIRYEHNLDLARYYMNLAGYDVGYIEPTSGLGPIITSSIIGVVVIILIFQKKRDER